ncbi:MAG: nuclear transport factor 2 family protein [Polyangiaceae bacterium]|nr:nuclear transport factor 2 family protein [Polyangiaceae bacterium]
MDVGRETTNFALNSPRLLPARPPRAAARRVGARPASPRGPLRSRVLALGALALLGAQAACGDDDDASASGRAGTAGVAGAAAAGSSGAGPAGAPPAAGAGGGAGSAGAGGGAGLAGQGGAPPGFAPPNAAAAPLVDALTRSLSDGDAPAIGARLAPQAFYVDALGRSDAPGAAAALLAGGPWVLASKVDSHHDVFRVQVRRGDADHVLFGGLDAEGRASWLALAAAPPTDTASTSPIIVAYQNAWNEGDAAARAALIGQSWSETARYVDPTADVRGRAGLDATITGFRAAFAGAGILPASGALEAQGLVHFRWRLEGGGAPPLDGMDVGFVGAEGTLTLIAGFFGPLPPP